MTPHAPSRRVWSYFGGLVALACLVGVAASMLIPKPPRRVLAPDDHTGAHRACREYVSSHLQSMAPDFATFDTARAVRVSNTRYRLRSAVASRGERGQAVHVRVSCTVGRLAADRWRLDDLSLTTD